MLEHKKEHSAVLQNACQSAAPHEREQEQFKQNAGKRG